MFVKCLAAICLQIIYKVIQDTLSSELELIREWVINNKFSLDLGKTEFILFSSTWKWHIYNTVQVLATN